MPVSSAIVGATHRPLCPCCALCSTLEPSHELIPSGVKRTKTVVMAAGYIATVQTQARGLQRGLHLRDLRPTSDLSKSTHLTCRLHTTVPAATQRPEVAGCRPEHATDLVVLHLCDCGVFVDASLRRPSNPYTEGLTGVGPGQTVEADLHEGTIGKAASNVVSGDFGNERI